MDNEQSQKNSIRDAFKMKGTSGAENPKWQRGKMQIPKGKK